MKSSASLLMVALLLALGVSARARAGEGATVATAASLGPFMREAAALYEAREGARVTVALGSSGALARQIENGAPYDLFASADESWIERLEAGGWIKRGKSRAYARGRLVLLLANHLDPFAEADGHAPLGAAGLARLSKPAIRYLALAHPGHAPFGRAAREALQRSGLWQSLAGKRVYAGNIRQALQFVQSGNADAGLVALSLVNAPRQRWRLVDEALHSPLTHTLALVTGGPEPAEAARFMAFLLSPAIQNLLRGHGLEPAGLADGEALR